MSTVSTIIEVSNLEKLRQLLSNGSSATNENSAILMQTNNSGEKTNKMNDSGTLSPKSQTENFTTDLQTRNDDELTSLTWLQDSNLLFGTALSQMKAINTEKNGSIRLNGMKTIPDKMEDIVKPKPIEVAPYPEIESPTSDSSEEHESHDVNEREYEIIESPQPASLEEDPVPYNPQIHVKSKPPYSFSSLIFMAIEDSNEKALPVKDIYSWVIRHFPYYRGAPTGWKNSVRHNLSLNKCFRKVDKSPTLGKGSLWMVDPAFRPNLLQTLNKTPFPSTIRTDHIYVTNIRRALNRNPLDHLNRLKEGVPISPEERIEGPVQLVNRDVFENGHPAINANNNSAPNSLLQLPNQTYFNLELHERPMLLKQVHKADVDAAAAMLVLKHGPMILQDNPHFTIKNVNSPVSTVANGWKSGRKRKQFHTELQDPNDVIIRSCTNIDHSYVSATDNCKCNDEIGTKKRKSLSKSNNESKIELKNEDGNEMEKRPYYEANALLKLASIATSLASTDMHQNLSYFNGSVTESEVLPAGKICNEIHPTVSTQSSNTCSNTPLNITNRKKKNLHPVKRILNNEIKILSNNNSCSILNKNDISHQDYRI